MHSDCKTCSTEQIFAKKKIGLLDKQHTVS